MTRIFFAFLFLCAGFGSFAQTKPKLFTLSINDTAVVVNGKSLTGYQLFTENAFKTLGRPEVSDTLSNLRSLNDHMSAIFNKYPSKGISLVQGNMTSRINKIMIFLNPVGSNAKYIDYVNNRFNGKLSILGASVDSTTTIEQLKNQLPKYEIKTYSRPLMDIFDAATGTRLGEIQFSLLPDKRIEYFSVIYYPTQHSPKLKMDYTGGKFKINNIIIDTMAGKSTALFKLLGPPDGIVPREWSVDGKGMYRMFEYLYPNSKGITFLENPASNSIESFTIDFLRLRKKTDLHNPAIDVKINGKVLDPEKVSYSGVEGMKSAFGFDSTRFNHDDYNNKKHLTVYHGNGILSFEGPEYGSRIYQISYNPTVLPERNRQWTKIYKQHPDLVIKNGTVTMHFDGKTKDWKNPADSLEVFSELLGTPKYLEYVIDYTDYGIRATNGTNNTLRALGFYYSNLSAGKSYYGTPYGYKGKISLEDKVLKTSMTFSDINKLLPEYGFKALSNDETCFIYGGAYQKVAVYVYIRKSTGALSHVLVARL